MLYILVDFEFLWVIDCHLDTQAAEFIIHLDTVRLHFKFDSPAFWTFTVIGDCFSQKLMVRFASQEGKDICTFEVIECVPNQGWIDILQSLAAFEHDIGCVLALVHTPVVSLVKGFFNRIKIRVYFMCEEIKLSAEAFGIELIGEFLSLWDIADLEKRVVIHLVGDAVFIKDMLHHLPAIDINLDQEGEPCLQLHMHKAKMFIKEIEIIIFAFAVHCVEGEQSIVMFPGLESLAVFNNREDADEPFIYRLVLQDF